MSTSPRATVYRSPLLTLSRRAARGVVAEWTLDLIPIGERPVLNNQVVELHVAVWDPSRDPGEAAASYREDVDADEVAAAGGEGAAEVAPRAATDVVFPSGESLPVVSGPEGRGEEFFDPNNSGNPLVDVSGPNRSKLLSPNFTAGEFGRSGSTVFDKARVDPALVSCLQALRNHVGKPVRITSGYRSYKHNVDVYRKRNKQPTLKSQHMSGRAADVTVAGMSGLEIAKAALDACGSELGIGIGKQYAHIDVRGTFAVWKYDGVPEASVQDLRRYREDAQRRVGPRTTAEAAGPPRGEVLALSQSSRVRFDVVTDAFALGGAPEDRVVRLLGSGTTAPDDTFLVEARATEFYRLGVGETLQSWREAFTRDRGDLTSRLVIVEEPEAGPRWHILTWWSARRREDRPRQGLHFLAEIDGVIRAQTDQPLRVGATSVSAGTIQIVLQYEDQSLMADAEFEAVFASQRVRGRTDSTGRAVLTVPAAENEVFRIFLLSYPQLLRERPRPEEPRPADLRPEVVTLFAFDSSFPGPAVFEHLVRVKAKSDATPEAKVVVFGHTDRVGGASYNRALSERRARAVLALLTNDRAMLDAVASDEGWDRRAYQSMLRGLGCNPGSIDGQDGPMLREATTAFQREYNQGAFHAHGAERASVDLEVDGVLGPATRAAIRDSYTSIAPHLPRERLADPAIAACGESHLVSQRDEENRRAVAAFYNPPAAPGPSPCEAYASVGETTADVRGSRFHDFQWLRSTDRAVHLSAITTVSDGTPVRFTLIRCEGPVPDPPPDSSGGGPPPTLGPTLATVDGEIRSGVAFARWMPPAEMDPFDPDTWLVDHDIQLEIERPEDHRLPGADDPASVEALLARDAIHPLLFIVQAGEHWAVSTPPGQRLDRIVFEGLPAGQGIALRGDGEIIPFSVVDGVVETERAQPVLAVSVLEQVVLPAPPVIGPRGGIGAPPPPPALNPARWGPILSAAVSPSAAVRTSNAVKFLIDGADTFRAMVDVIRTAQSNEHYIYLLGWILQDAFEIIPGDPDSTAQRLFTLASGRGVQIRAVLWDQVGTANRDEVKRINALPTGAAIEDDETPHHVVGSHHQKVLVVKGSRGLITFCGGIDINEDRIRPVSTGAPQHDVHCRVEGPAAFDLLQTFIRRWDHHPKHVALDRTRGALLGRTEPVPAPITTPPPGSTSTGRPCSVCVARTFNPVARGVIMPRERDIQNLLIAAIHNARRFIYMEDQYLIHPRVALELRAAVPRLQHLTILTTASEILAGSAGLGSGGLPCVWKMRREFINLLTAGLSPSALAKVRIFFLVTPPPPPPGTAPTFGTHTYVHAKTWVFDDELAVIGSANCNRRGWTHDSEVNAFVFDDRPAPSPTFAQQMRMHLWAEHLNVAPSTVADGVASAGLWLSPPAGAHVMPYNPTADRDLNPLCLGTTFINTVVDPEIP